MFKVSMFKVKDENHNEHWLKNNVDWNGSRVPDVNFERWTGFCMIGTSVMKGLITEQLKRLCF